VTAETIDIILSRALVVVPCVLVIWALLPWKWERE